MAVINELKTKFGESELFGHEKAAMLLYLVVKNHSFSDGNKRTPMTEQEYKKVFATKKNNQYKTVFHDSRG